MADRGARQYDLTFESRSRGKMTDSKTRSQKQVRTQWTAQFLVASELVRQYCTVAFTMGNHTPDADLMVGAPSGKQYWIDVKGQSAKGGWIIKEKSDRLNLFYVLVLVGLKRQEDRFFVLTQREVNHLIRQYATTHPNAKHDMQGFSWKDADKPEYENKWKKLPT